MLIVIDLVEERVLLTQPNDFSRFSVGVEGGADPELLAEVVHQAGLGTLQPGGDHLVVDPIALRALAGDVATAEWDEGLAAMGAYAATKGWVADNGGILAHIDWDADPG